MKTATHKQAIQIHNLSYIYYVLSSSENIDTIIPFDKAKALPYSIAEKMLENLKHKIEKTEDRIYLNDYVWSTDKLIKHTPITLVQNYKKIDSFKIYPADKVAEIVTLEGEKIVLDLNLRLMNESWNIGIDELNKILVQAIDEDKSVNIYRIDNKVIHIFLEDNERDKQYKWVAKHYNNILKSTNGILPHNTKDEIQYKKVMNIVKAREIETYMELKSYFNKEHKYNAIKQVIEYAKAGFYGMTLTTRGISYY